ncbi:MAG: branched-chain amino acid transport system ATP-binding protein [Myxococcota bacterium]
MEAHLSEGIVSEPVLEVAGVTKRFGGLTAVSNFSITLSPGELVGLIGPNGAGKTTVFNLITGVYTPTEGTIAVCGTDTAGLTPDRITALGIARTFQNIRLFDEMTVLENVKTAYNLRSDYGLIDAIFRTRRFKEQEAALHTRAMDLLTTMGLADDADERAASLAYGEQRRLEIARALATEPKLLILDEPAAGMNAQETDDLMAMIHDIRDRFSLTLLLIEHDMKFIMKMCERIVVLDQGCIIARGVPEAIKVDPAVITAYLGDESEEG